MLEERSLLAGQAFAVVDGVLSPTGTDKVTIQVSRHDFTLNKSGQLVLELIAATSGGTPLAIGAPVARTPGTVGRAAAAAHNWRIAALAPGTFTFAISGGAAGASYAVDFSLAGDVNHNGTVNSTDINAIRSRVGVTSTRPRFLPGADLFQQNRINMADLHFALSNKGAATTLEPLALSTSADPPGASDPSANVVVHSLPNAHITITERGVPVGSGQIKKTGAAAFAVDLLAGQNAFGVVATDAFGQRVIRAEHITRANLANYLEAAYQPYVGQWTGTRADLVRAPLQQLWLGQRQRCQSGRRWSRRNSRRSRPTAPAMRVIILPQRPITRSIRRGWSAGPQPHTTRLRRLSSSRLTKVSTSSSSRIPKISTCR